MTEQSISLKEHFATLREADLRAVELVREWTKERLETHNNLLTKWQAATEKDRENFASKDALEATRAAFDTYKEITAKALALAEGKSKGRGDVWGYIVAAAALGAAVSAILSFAVRTFT